MTPKERVRIEVYKTLLKEEQNKGKRKSYLTMSVFMVGIFAGTLYNIIPNQSNNVQDNLTHLVSAPTYSIQNVENDHIDNYFNINLKNEKDEMKTDEYFVLNIQS